MSDTRSAVSTSAAALMMLMLSSPDPASTAPIYKCTAKDGSTVYADASCGSDARVQAVNPAAAGTVAPPARAPLATTSGQSRPEALALQCTTDNFNQWVRAQRPMPDWPVRRVKLIEITNQCRRTLHLPEMSATPAVAERETVPSHVPADGTLASLVKDDSIEGLRTYLSRPGVTVNDRSDADEALLDHAAEQDQVKVARFLIDQGARVDARQSKGPNRGLTALHRAAAVDASEVAELLIVHRAEVNVLGPLGVTPLIVAASNGSRKTARVLLLHGADVFVATGHLQTALSEATTHNHPDIVQLLLMNVPVPSTQILSDVASRADVGKVRLMLMHDALAHDIAAASKDTALRFAVLGGANRPIERQQIIELLIAHGADVNNRVNNAPNTPLMLATTPKIAQLLILHGADIRAEDSFGATALEAAACNRFASDPIGTVKVLLAHGAELRVPPRKGLSALQCAVLTHRADLAEFLLANGSRVDARDAQGRTALFDATDWPTMAVLLKHGAQIDAIDNQGRSAPAKALAQGRQP